MKTTCRVNVLRTSRSRDIPVSLPSPNTGGLRNHWGSGGRIVPYIRTLCSSLDSLHLSFLPSETILRPSVSGAITLDEQVFAD